MGWDGLDEVKVAAARLPHARRSSTSRSATTAPRAGASAHRLRHGAALGPRRPGTWATARATSSCARCYRARREPAALAMLWGYAAEAVRRSPRCADAAVVAAVQERQALTSLLRHGLPART